MYDHRKWERFELVLLVFYLLGTAIGLACVFVIGEQAFHWLKHGTIPPRNIAWFVTDLLQMPLPATEWIGLNEVISIVMHLHVVAFGIAIGVAGAVLLKTIEWKLFE